MATGQTVDITTLSVNPTDVLSCVVDVVDGLGETATDSATVVLQGSNDGITYATLKDPSGANLSFTAAGYAEFSSGAAFIKPSISGGTGDSLNIWWPWWT